MIGLKVTNEAGRVSGERSGQALRYQSALNAHEKPVILLLSLGSKSFHCCKAQRQLRQFILGQGWEGLKDVGELDPQ